MVPTRTTEQIRDELDAAYIDAHAFVMHYLDAINARIHDMPAPESDGLNWAHIGSMNKVKDDLREIVEFLSGSGQ
jgi:hypothetical protein